MKKLILCLCSLAFFAVAVTAQVMTTPVPVLTPRVQADGWDDWDDWGNDEPVPTIQPVSADTSGKSANELYKQGLFRQAITAFEPLLKSKNATERYEAQLKTALAYQYSYQYDAGLKAIYSFEVPKDDVWAARYFIVRANLLGQQTRYNATDLIESETDPTKFTDNQRQAAIKDAYQKLWDMRKKLIEMPTEESLVFLTRYYQPSANLVLTPTLFDYLRLQFVSSNVVDYDKSLEESFTLGGRNRGAVRELSRIERMIRAHNNDPKTREFRLPLADNLAYTAGYLKDVDQKNPFLFRAVEVLAQANASLEAAKFYIEGNDYLKAYAITEYCLSLQPNYFSSQCKSMKDRLEAKRFSISGRPDFNAPLKDTTLKINSANLDYVYMNIYRLKPEFFASNYDEAFYKVFNERDMKLGTTPEKKKMFETMLASGGWTQFPGWHAQKRILEDLAPVRTITYSLKYPTKFAPADTVLDIPFIKPGLYAIVISTGKTPSERDNQMVFLNFTNIAGYSTAFATTNDLNAMPFKGAAFNAYALSAIDGQPRAGVNMIGKGSHTSGRDGAVRIDSLVTLNRNRDSLNLLLQQGDNYAILNTIYFSFQKEQTYSINLNTDRSIYRPGQEVKVQANVIEYKAPNFTVYSGKKQLELTLKNPHYQTVETKTLSLNDMGAASATFTLPDSGLLGGFSITARIEDQSASIPVTVEEYKRPDFEAELKPLSGIAVYDKPVTIEGFARYFHGAAVPNAQVKYSISKTYFNPWFCWWWGPVKQNRQDRIDGQTKTGKDGSFKINFTPKQDDVDKEFRGRPARYFVEAFITDDGGRTIKTSRTITVSGQEYFFAMKMDKGFFRQNKANTVQVNLVNADEKPLKGKAEARLYSATIDTQNNSGGGIPIVPLARIIPPGGQEFPALKEDKLVSSFPVEFKEEAAVPVNIPALKEGYYILKMATKDSAGKDNEGRLVFMVINTDNPQIELPYGVTIAENKTYYPGETAFVLIGASAAKGQKFVEIYKNQFIVDEQKLSKPGPVVVEIPINNELRGGISLAWFSVYDYKGYSGSVNIEVPFPNTKLNLEIKAAKDALPGADFKAALEAKDETGKPVNAQALVTVYDKSLDYYKPHSLNMPNPYPSARFGHNPMGSSFSMERFYPSFYDGDFGGGGLRAGRMLESPVAFKSAAPMAANMAMPEMASFAMADAAEDDSGSYGVRGAVAAGAPAAPVVEIRENFAETAFFAPDLNIKNGAADFIFKTPQRLTQWSILAAAFTKDIKTGKTSATFTTSKDLMIRLETPRFLREDDRLELRTIVNNNSDKTLNIEVDLTAKLNGEDAAKALALKTTRQQLTIPAKGQAFATWPLTAPRTQGELSFTAVARSGSLSDGELKTLPLLPALQRLTESSIAALDETGKAEVSIEGVLKNKDAALEAVHLTIDPSLIMPVINAIPLITFSRHETVTGLLNSWLPLAIMNDIYAKYPDIKSAVSKLPQRTTVTPAWDIKEDMLITELGATPWFNLSRGFETTLRTINIFDPTLVKKTEASVLEKLTKYQNADGGFTWVKGGQSSIFITLSVIESMAQAKSYGIKIPEASVKRALKYLTGQIRVNTKDPSYENLSTALYMAYVLTAFPKDWHNFDVKAFVDTANGYPEYLTPVGKAHAAAVYTRLGEEKKAREYLVRLFDGASEDPVNGMFWKPEERSWMWFNDSLGLHTTVIRVLMEINPEDPRLAKLVKWLMFSRKATMWGGSEPAAKAVYTLLDVIRKTSDLTQTKTYTAHWAGEKLAFTVKPFDLSGKKTFSKYAPEAGENSLKATVTRITQEGKPTIMPDFVSLTALFTTKKAVQPAKGMLNVSKAYFLVKDKAVQLLKDGDTIAVGDEVQVRLTISTGNAFNYVILEDPKPAAFEGDALLSGWRYDQIGRFEEIRDSKTNFFLDWLPNGTYELKYTMRPTTAGSYNVGAAVMQSAYAPEFATHSAGFTINVR